MIQMSTTNTILNCSSCGGKLEVDDTKSVIRCPFCGTSHSVADLLKDSEEVKIERIRRDVELGRQNLENERLQQQRETVQHQHEINRLNDFKSSKLLKFLIGLTVVSTLLCFVFFRTGRILSGIISVIMVGLSLTAILMGMQVIKEKFNRMYILPVIGALMLIVPMFASVGVRVDYSAIKYEKYIWNEIVLNQELPKPPSDTGIIYSNTKSSLNMTINNISVNQYYSYAEKCKNNGYTVDTNESDRSFSGFNGNGYGLELRFYDNKKRSRAYVTIKLESPEEMGTFEWPNSELGQIIPKPESQIGIVRSESSGGFVITVGNTNREQFNAYVNLCFEKGFDVDYQKGDDYFIAASIDGYNISLRYEGNNIMNISVEAPEKFGFFEWPNNEIGRVVPKPESNSGKIISDSSKGFCIKVGNTNKEQYNTYVNKCIENGFDVDYDKSDNYYNAKNDSGYHIALRYEGHNIMTIDADAPVEITISVPENSYSFTGDDYEDVISTLKKAGFTNITTEPQYDIVWGITTEGATAKVSINGKTDFSKGDKFPSNATVIVKYHLKVESDPNNSTLSEESNSSSLGQEETYPVPQTPVVYTTENCEDLQNLVFLDRVADENTIKSVVNSYNGKTIELELLTAFVEPYKEYNTRFNYLLYAINPQNTNNVLLVGPAFMFENVSPAGLKYIGSTIPNSFGTGIRCRVKAKIDGYKDGMIMLEPETIEVID